MTDRTTINVTKDAHQEAKEAKKDDESWSDYIQRCVNPDVDNSVTLGPGYEEIAENIAEAIQGEISMANEPGVTVDVEGLNKEIRKLQELVERVPENTAEQLESKYR